MVVVGDSVSSSRSLVASMVSSSSGPLVVTLAGTVHVVAGKDEKLTAAEYCWLTIKIAVPATELG
jgi:hypothetical protein